MNYAAERAQTIYPFPSTRNMPEVAEDIAAISKQIRELPTVDELNRITKLENAARVEIGLGKIDQARLDEILAEKRRMTEAERNREPLMERLAALNIERDDLVAQENRAHKKDMVKQAERLYAIYRSQCRTALGTLMELIDLENKYGGNIPVENFNVSHELYFNAPCINSHHSLISTAHHAAAGGSVKQD